MAKSRMNDQAAQRIGELVNQYLGDELPKLADAMHAAGNDYPHKGKLTLTVEWSFKPSSETEPQPQETLRVLAQLSTPKHATEAAKVIWSDGQMTLL